MTEISNPDERTDPKYPYRPFPPRYPTVAAPNETVVEWACTLPVGSSILDLACGEGRHLIYLGERGFWMSGVDKSPANLRISKNMCDEHQLPFDGHVADMSALPWADGTFDAAFSTSTTGHHRREDIVKTINEVWRILRPGGFFMVDFLPTETPVYRAESNHLISAKHAAFKDHSQESVTLDEAEVRDLLRSFELLKLWTDLPPRIAHERLPRHGSMVAWARKPVSEITRMILRSIQSGAAEKRQEKRNG